MSFFDEIDQHLDVLRDVVGEVDAGALPSTVAGSRDADVLRVIRESTTVIEALAALRIAASGVLAARSRREQGHGGVAAGEGHRSAVSLVQEITGTTRTEAAKQVRLGESLLDGAKLLGTTRARSAESEPDAADAGGGAGAASPVREPWHAPLGRAQLAGTLSAAQHHAILHGLGDPPAPGDPAVDAEFAEAWSLAASQLSEEAAHRTVEELAGAARTIRDRLDPVGAEERFAARFDGRSFRMWKDAHGVAHGHLTFDDESAVFLQSVFDSALRPRRGGPRFVADDEKAAAAELQDDPRTNTQLEFDLLLDILRAGVLADTKAVHGTRQAGVRIVVTDNAWEKSHAGVPAIAHLEDGLTALPAWAAAQRACDGGTRTIWIDGTGEPLRLGREQRLYSSGSASPSPSATADAAGPAATAPPRCARPITSTPTPRAAEPTSTAASSSAGSTTCSSTTTDGASPGKIAKSSSCTRPPEKAHPSRSPHGSRSPSRGPTSPRRSPGSAPHRGRQPRRTRPTGRAASPRRAPWRRGRARGRRARGRS
jgi:hypothetical protein